MMTVMGNALLNEIVKVNKVTSPAKILELLDRKVAETLQQHENIARPDGMDISILVFKPDMKEVTFAGAKHALLLVRNGGMERIMGTKLSIGGRHGAIDKFFEEQKIELMPGDRLYMHTDGYPDQFGGEKDSKFMSKQFREMLQQYSQLDMQEQKDIFLNMFKGWKGHREQTDDVLVIGIKI
jgi:serine phosphatase RsbU (regulator of sigma subunit)